MQILYTDNFGRYLAHPSAGLVYSSRYFHKVNAWKVYLITFIVYCPIYLELTLLTTIWVVVGIPPWIAVAHPILSAVVTFVHRIVGQSGAVERHFIGHPSGVVRGLCMKFITIYIAGISLVVGPF